AHPGSGVGAAGAKRDQFTAQRLQVCPAGKIAGDGPPATRLRAGERGRSGASQDVYGGGPGANHGRPARRGGRRACRGGHQEDCRTGRRPAVAGLPDLSPRRPARPARKRTIRARVIMDAVMSRRANWVASVQSLLGTVVIAIFVITFVVQAFQIPSESMENTLL